MCLADGVTLKRGVDQDEKIFMSDIAHDSDRVEFALFSKAMEEAGQIPR